MNKVTLGCLGIIVLLILGTLVTGCSMYNGLVTKSQRVDGQWAQVQNVYQRRADLVPNLVQTVAGSANFEKSTLEAVTNARASVGRVSIDAHNAPADAAKLQEFQQAQGQLSSALSRLLVVSENYPDIKSSQNFRDLQAQLEGTENRIAVERNRFNEVTRDYNTAIHTFPAVLFAGMFGFHEKPFFAADQAAQTAPAVQFNFNNK
ncbi:MAG: LemA family protein [Phycisphaerales bacterium]|nr:LemA family protein [Phycisphaerales bacterium]